jgi:hypothetical protein
MTAAEALAFVKEHGVVLVSAKGPVPRLTEAIAGEPIKGSWWGHSKSHRIFAILEVVTESEEVLVCRLVKGKITLVHRRLWPALVRVAKRFPPNRISKVKQEHTASGRHVNKEVPFPRWVPAEVMKQAKSLSEEEAIAALGEWVLTAGQ